MTKICTNCKLEKSLDKFGKHRKNSDGLNTECKECNATRAKKWASDNKVKNIARASTWNKQNRERHNEISVKWNANNKRKKKDTHLKRNFGISLEQYDGIFAAQNGKCAICGNTESTLDRRSGEPKMLSVDHDHITGKIRGLLCQRCNLILGLFEDSTSNLIMAIKYLEKSNGN